MINIKYYIVLIMTMFLSIGVGIFVGFNIENNDMIENSQAALAEQIELEFSKLRDENKSLLDELSRLTKERNTYETINRIMYKELTKDKLAGMKVAIIQLGDSYDYQDMRNTLEAAGAEVASWQIMKNSAFDVKKLQNDILAWLPAERDNAREPYRWLAQQTVYGLEQGLETDIYKMIVKKGYIEPIVDIKSIPDFIILAVGGFQDEQLETEFVRAVKQTDIPVTAVEQEAVSNSHMQIYKKEDISTIDNVDSFTGKLSLIAVIRGVQGHFGVKPSADNIMPDSMEEPEQEVRDKNAP